VEDEGEGDTSRTQPVVDSQRHDQTVKECRKSVCPVGQ
jgi:hypothetical protein